MSGPDAAVQAALHKTQGELIAAQQRRMERRFGAGVGVSWLVLFGILMFLFSGAQLDVGGLSIRTIQLDGAFIRQWAPFIAEGVGQTLTISVASIAFATLLALLAALGRISRIAPVYAVSTFYVSIIRGTPLFLQIMFFFLALPQLGVQMSGFTAGVMALGINYGAYMSEVFRAGILSVGKGQREAAQALGMTYPQTMRRIVLPQALRFALPPTGNEFIAMLKDSALVSVTGFVHELMWRAQRAGRANFKSLEALLVAAAFYWAMTLVFTLLQSRLEKYLSRGER